MRILLVEDEEDLGLAIKQVLVSEKYIVDWVVDGVDQAFLIDSELCLFTQLFSVAL